MLCNNCKKREAKIYYTEIANGEKKEQHLCEECAAEYTSFFVMDNLQNKEFFLGGLLAGLLEGFTAKTEEPTVKTEEPACNNCGMTLDTFFKSGHFGCAKCYESFGKNLPRMLRNVQGGDTHNGKKPKGYIPPERTSEEKRAVLTEQDKLRLKLQQAIEKEEFEEAAKLRDAIKLINTNSTKKS